MMSPGRSHGAQRPRSVGARADGDLVDALNVKFRVVCRIEGGFLVNALDEEVTELVLVDFTVRLLGIAHF